MYARTISMTAKPRNTEAHRFMPTDANFQAEFRRKTADLVHYPHRFECKRCGDSKPLLGRKSQPVEGSSKTRYVCVDCLGVAA